MLFHHVPSEGVQPSNYVPETNLLPYEAWNILETNIPLEQQSAIDGNRQTSPSDPRIRISYQKQPHSIVPNIHS